LSGEDFNQLPQYFGYVFHLVLTVGCLYGTIIGLSALSREENEGTIEFLYAKPVKRPRIVTAKLGASALVYFIYFAALGLGSIIAAISVRPADLPLPGLLLAMKSILVGGMLTGFCYFFLGYAVSVFLKKAKHAASIAMAIFFGTYLVGAIPDATGVLDFLKWVSPMNYFVPKDVVMNGISFLNTLIALGIMAVYALTAYRVYAKKDFVL
jgi:ABC-2 type transport system permease protein